MPQRTLRFHIRQDGYVEESVEGTIGESCETLTKSLEDALGQVQTRVPTSEAFLASQKQVQSLPAELI